jgi:hypothetical protein
VAISDSQVVDVRRWAGYGMAGNPSLAIYEDPVYSHGGPAWGLNRLTLADKLAGLTDAESLVLTDTFLDPLTTLETAILGAADNMDTEQAGPWKSNPREVAQRTALFNKWRRDMCAFLGIPPGPALGSGGITLVRG